MPILLQLGSVPLFSISFKLPCTAAIIREGLHNLETLIFRSISPWWRNQARYHLLVLHYFIHMYKRSIFLQQCVYLVVQSYEVSPNRRNKLVQPCVIICTVLVWRWRNPCCSYATRASWKILALPISYGHGSDGISRIKTNFWLACSLGPMSLSRYSSSHILGRHIIPLFSGSGKKELFVKRFIPRGTFYAAMKALSLGCILHLCAANESEYFGSWNGSLRKRANGEEPVQVTSRTTVVFLYKAAWCCDLIGISK